MKLQQCFNCLLLYYTAFVWSVSLFIWKEDVGKQFTQILFYVCKYLLYKHLLFYIRYRYSADNVINVLSLPNIMVIRELKIREIIVIKKEKSKELCYLTSLF